MDDIVKQAIAKWPHVPHCYGWLGLDARGQWYLRDAATQALGGFHAARGSRLQHAKLIEFIHRNYQADACGRWYFQNGPQRVYVELEAAPLIWRLDPDGAPVAHTGQRADGVQECLVDECGRVYLACALGLGLVHSLDVAVVAQQIEQGRWLAREVCAADLPAAYGFVLSPASLPQT
ncbi:DUF2946 family protein [Alicycliphilus denitrificans]|uniref:DUF2946 family protein n=1 Tax=Alicycliphilus denitrificans TaxID=179636 RepID=UPI00384E5C90